MPQRRCICLGCTACKPTGCRKLYNIANDSTRRCPACQAITTTQRQRRVSSSTRGYNGEYQRNKPIIISQGRNGRPCVICHKPIQPYQKVTVEHITPLRSGGTNHLANLGPAHSSCNTAWNKKR